jgi:hypothetical protein
MTFLHKLIITNKYLRYTPFWWWFRLMSHSGFRFDDYHIWKEFWHSLNAEWEQMEYVNEFEKYWGKSSYPPESIILSQRDFDALTERLNEKPDPEALESIRKLLDRRAPWDT